ncbi:MAG TPA: BadF/BadG/BcrA/BcrD ATPase family protein [Candidatus Dormibacteraeota bacterium]|nr:BadF/BadG/BcrA/BcrD ATPase family protein [Candidatus Dormibacteraeota bacterium]
MKLFAGVDVGQSATKAVIADERGRVLARGESHAGDELGLPASSTRLRDAVESALASARRRAGLPSSRRYESVTIGISGYDGALRGRAPRLQARVLRYTHDSRSAMAGALPGGAGIVAIAGTGSVVLARNRVGEEFCVGGHGYLFGDEGSAFGIVRDAVRAALTLEDARRDSRLLAALVAHFGCEQRSLAQRFYTAQLSRSEVAAFAPALCALAADREPSARAILAEHAAALVDRIRSAATRSKLRQPALVIVGGLAANAAYNAALSRALRARLPRARRIAAQYDPTLGALLLAFGAAGAPCGEIEERR